MEFFLTGLKYWVSILKQDREKLIQETNEIRVIINLMMAI